MPRRQDIDSVLIIGAGPIVIGQACEFDYSGAQACKALKEEGFRVILINSNPATIMTDPNTADAVYIEPISWQAVEKIIEKEKKFNNIREGSDDGSMSVSSSRVGGDSFLLNRKWIPNPEKVQVESEF